MLTGGFEERRSSEGRLVGLRVIFIACISVLAVGFWLLQVVDSAKYDEMAANNHLRTIPLRAPRGVLFDRNGRVLVENRNSFTIAIVREHVANLDQTIRRIAEATGVTRRSIRDAVQRRRREPLFRPMPVIEHATFAQVAAVVVAQARAAGSRRPAGAHARVSDGRSRRRTSSATSARSRSRSSATPEYSALQSGAVVGQAASRRRTTAI